MIVDRDNFPQARSQIMELFSQNIRYIGFDLELTGIRGDIKNDQVWAIPSSTFANYREIVKKYKIIQLGLTFVVGKSDGELDAYPFIFFVLPAERKNGEADYFSIELGAINFLS